MSKRCGDQQWRTPETAKISTLITSIILQYLSKWSFGSHHYLMLKWRSKNVFWRVEQIRNDQSFTPIIISWIVGNVIKSEQKFVAYFPNWPKRLIMVLLSAKLKAIHIIRVYFNILYSKISQQSMIFHWKLNLVEVVDVIFYWLTCWYFVMKTVRFHLKLFSNVDKMIYNSFRCMLDHICAQISHRMVSF